LQDAAPFFGGASRLTLAEVKIFLHFRPSIRINQWCLNFFQVQTGSFLLRVLSFPKYEGLLPKSLPTTLESKAPAFWKWANEVIKEKSVTYIWNEKAVAERTQERIAKLAAAKWWSHFFLVKEFNSDGSQDMIVLPEFNVFYDVYVPPNIA
jgi:glutathione S-transferase